MPGFFLVRQAGAQRRDWRYPVRCGGGLGDLGVKVPMAVAGVLSAIRRHDARNKLSAFHHHWR